MALTRIRAQQISDIDYKQAVRVITVANVTLSGGAPSTVDGVNLVAGDRILVAGQTTGSQNGLYDVSVLGTGANGTWVRTADGDVTGEIEAGMIVMVTEGTVYRDTQWKLTTNNPIIIGTTPLTFEQNSAFAFGNIYANGTAVLATSVGDSLVLTPGDNIAITGNNTSKTVTIAVTGISLNSISNGTSNVNVVSSGGDVTIGVGGTANVGVFSPTGLAITGDLSVSGNATLSGNILGDRIVNGTTSIEIQTASGNANISVGGTSNITVFTTTGQEVSGSISATGNITGGNILTLGLVSAAGNISGSRFLGNGTQLTGINAFGNIAVTGETTVSADSTSDILTFAEGSGIAITTDAANNTITFSAAGTDSIFATGGDMGTVDEAVTSEEDLGTVDVAASVEYDLGSIVTSGVLYPDQLVLPIYTVNSLPSASVVASFIYVSNESGGAVPAFADGTNWRRVTDRAIVS